MDCQTRQHLLKELPDRTASIKGLSDKTTSKKGTVRQDIIYLV